MRKISTHSLKETRDNYLPSIRMGGSVLTLIEANQNKSNKKKKDLLPMQRSTCLNMTSIHKGSFCFLPSLCPNTSKIPESIITEELGRKSAHSFSNPILQKKMLKQQKIICWLILF